MIKTKIAGAVLMLGLAAGCGSQVASHNQSHSPVPVTAVSIARQIGATNIQPVDGQRELYVRDEVSAMYQGQDVTVYVFSNDQGETSWKQVASTFGVNILKEGPLWIVAN